MRTFFEKQAERNANVLLRALLVLVCFCFWDAVGYAQGMSIDGFSTPGRSGFESPSDAAADVDDSDLPMIDMSLFTDQSQKSHQLEEVDEKDADKKEDAYQTDKLYEVTSIKAITELVKENELILHMDTRPEVVKPIKAETPEARLRKLLILFIVAILLLVVLFYVLSTLYLLRISREAGKLRMDTVDMHTNAAWLEECERDAKKVRHYDESWDRIDDDLYQNSPY